jgi:hypothetical protein
VRGLDSETFKFIDTGKSRGAGDTLSISGFPSAKRLAAAAKVYYGLVDDDYPTSVVNKTYTRLRNDGVYKVVEAAPHLLEWVRFLGKSEFVGVRNGPLAIYTAVAAATSEDSYDKAMEFWSGVVTGVGLERGAPALALRQKMLRLRVKNEMAQHWQWVGWTIAAWNAFYRGRNIHRLNIKGRQIQFIEGWTRPDFSHIE